MNKRFYIDSAMSLSADDGILQTDGSLWSQAASRGTRFRCGESFTIDDDTVQNFVKSFNDGVRAKVPVDYDHASTDGDPEVSRLRAKGEVPKAGTVLEMRAIKSVADFTGDLKTAADKLAALAGRSLDDPKNFGLWTRWRPTANALQKIKAGEYSEFSISFVDAWENSANGEDAGPTILAIALTNLPFLDDMLPVAASLLDTSRSVNPHKEISMTVNAKLLSLAVAMTGKAVATDEDAINELQAYQPRVATLTQFRDVIGAELETDDAVKGVAKIRELKSGLATAQQAAAEQKKAAIATQVETTLTKYEKCLTVPLRKMIGNALTVELEAGKKLDETDTLATLKSLSSTGITERRAGADVEGGGADADDDKKLDAAAHELMASDPEVKALYGNFGFSRAFALALQKANKKLLGENVK